MLTGRLLTSPVPHANILEIDKSKAERLPGVEAIITFHDVPKKMFNPNKMDLTLLDPSGELPDMYVLSDKARFVGDLIAAVAAINTSIAEEALELIEVTYEELSAVFDPIEATQPGQPRIHDFAKNNNGFLTQAWKNIKPRLSRIIGYNLEFFGDDDIAGND